MSKQNQSIDLLRRLDSLGREGDLVSSLLDDLFHFHGFSPLNTIANPDFSPSIEYTKLEDSYVITAEVPGINKNDINIEIDGDILVVKGEKKYNKQEQKEEYFVRERCYGSFRREIRLPTDSNKNDIEASYEEGILKLKIPKIKQIEKETKTIAIK